MLILVDSGSTGSFISDKEAQSLALPVSTVPKVTVTVADGERNLVTQLLLVLNGNAKAMILSQHCECFLYLAMM